MKCLTKQNTTIIYTRWNENLTNMNTQM